MSAPCSDSQKESATSKSQEEAACCEQRSITETVTNGSMKETVSLTVDAKTETAVFKRFAKHTSSKKGVWSCLLRDWMLSGLVSPVVVGAGGASVDQ